MLNSIITPIVVRQLPIIRRTITTVTVIGSGLMGSGIAQICAQSDYRVHLVDVNDSLLKNANERIATSLSRVANKKYANDVGEQQKFVKKCQDLIELSTNAFGVANKSDLVIEAIVENIDEKLRLFRKLDEVASPSCIFVSNTSSLSITEISAATKRQDKFGGLHFFNPVPAMDLVEVIGTDRTSEDTTKKLVEFAKSVGKVPVRCRDTPGFIVNRLLVPYMMEAVRMVERGDATVEDVDIAMKLGAGHPMGPFTLLDFVGLDVGKFIVDGWHSKFPDNPLFNPSPRIDKLVKEGKLGRKSGHGFYDYSKTVSKK